MNITRIHGRFLHTAKKRLAVIGSGPSAFYTVLQILKKNPHDYEIDMFEKNPSPFGLVRYGVAPDHPEVKNCIDKFNEIKDHITENDSTFKYYGNVEISKDLSLKQLYDNYNGVLYAYGSSHGNNVEFPGSLHPSVINSYDFVNWYNGHSKYLGVLPTLKNVKNIAVIGAGNVALDIVRILLGDTMTRWEKTDISHHALQVLKESAVKNVHLVVRRGVLDSKFTNKELRELLEMQSEGVVFDGWNKEDFEEQLGDKSVKLDRINKRRLQLLGKYDNAQGGEKAWKLNYLRSPIGVMVNNDGSLKELLLAVGKMEKCDDGSWKVAKTSKIESLPTDLIIMATGYQCKPLEGFEELGIPFHNGKIANENGKVEGVDNSYCVGWISNNSQGNINSTVNDSMNVAETILQDLSTDESKKGRAVIDQLLKEKKVQVVDWNDWNKIHEIEISRGKEKNKPFEKLSFDEMLELVK